jgi:predicted ATP-dependent endonuclease of OLD family
MGAHANSILLLDDPGLSLHGSAQAKAVEFLDKLSKDNQLLYTTHSPFMIDVGHLERARAVYEDTEGTTKVSDDVWPKDRDSLFPLQAALGYQLAQSLFISKRQLIVEGLTDLWLLKALDRALVAVGRTGLRSDVVIVPSAGVTKLFPLASMLIGHDVEIAALLDGDEPGRREGKRLAEKLLAGEDRKCLFVGDFVDNSEAEIEDIFPEQEYLSAVREAYPGTQIELNAAEKALRGVVNKVTAVFERKGFGRFDTWKPAAVLRDRVTGSPGNVDASTLDAIEHIFEKVNTLFARQA